MKSMEIEFHARSEISNDLRIEKAARLRVPDLERT